jgi:hypothetical protein
MRRIYEGARQLPLRHLSIRIPWNDTDWTGKVCQNPADNISCLILPRVREKRDDKFETGLAGRSWEELDQKDLPPCVSERGSFMAPYEMTRWLEHPYAKSSNAHKHLRPTPFRHPPYSAACLPFRWMLKENVATHVGSLELGFRTELEENAHAQMGFETDWVQEKHNQLVMLDTFFSAIQPSRSLAFFYAKRTPLAEDTRRVIIGVGRVTHVGDPVEYRYGEPMGDLRSVLWERTIQHSIRPKFTDGFLFPYHEVIDYLEAHPEEDPNRYIAFVPDDQFWAFSYASEHVTNDGAIAALLSCIRATTNIQQIIPGPWDRALGWIDQRLNELWAMRGPYPGLGAALTAFGINQGTLLAYEIENILAETRLSIGLDPWGVVGQIIQKPETYPKEISSKVGPTLRKKWESLPDERRALLKLLSRFELSAEQATRFYVHEDKQRAAARIDVTDSKILANPYLLYELDRVSPEPISLAIIDRGLFPEAVIRENHPLQPPSQIEDAQDARRVRAFVVRQLEEAALNGDTLRPRNQIIQEIRGLEIQPSCPVDGDLMAVVEPTFDPNVKSVQLAEGQPAYQLERLYEVGNLIRSSVTRRLRGVRHSSSVKWRAELDAALKGPAPLDDPAEENARQEKTAALEELFASRISVLIGPAGTGKTTLLKVLCHADPVRLGGVLMLAPTGKARVRMETQTEIKGAQTIAQFLLPLGRYDPETGIYHTSGQPNIEVGKTVIIDEASMLTEEQLAAVLDALKGVERLILVGDPRQLPPIGAGRPFLDIVRELQPKNVDSLFPRIGQGYAELTVRRRQKGQIRNDLLLADWFSGRSLDPGADEIWDLIKDDEVSEHLRFIRWDHPDELQDKILAAVVDELKLKGIDDIAGFECSLGGTTYNNRVFFWAGRNNEPGACGKIEDWQVLSPVRNASHGVDALNRLIQTTFRYRTKEFARNKFRRKIPKPMGPEEILYGDKVINVRNQRRYNVWPKENALSYVANGEIGIVVGQFKTANAAWKGLPRKLEVEFSSQPGYKYDYGGRDFGEEASPTLELAYALTVHKTQGSEFGITFVILPNPCRLLSRELLYTALTRQKGRVIVLHQGDRHEMRRYSEDYHSEAARRLTNLFQEAHPVELRDRFLEDGLIHKTRRGESVRSKSEVIIANELHRLNIDYSYELAFIGNDGKVRYPDFTIEDAETGQIIIWEHLGLLHDPVYRKRWEVKLAWYRGEGVLPWKEGGGSRATLVITQDDERGGIDTGEIDRIIEEVYG